MILAVEKIAIMLAQRVIPVLLVLLMASHAWSAGEKPSEFLADLSDVPLAPGLSEVEGERLVFDKPEGRIVQAVATGKRPVEEIAGFYRATLPQLGWQAMAGEEPAKVPDTDEQARVQPVDVADRLLFSRDAEQLEIVLETVYETLVVRFSLEPSP